MGQTHGTTKDYKPVKTSEDFVKTLEDHSEHCPEFSSSKTPKIYTPVKTSEDYTKTSKDHSEHCPELSTSKVYTPVKTSEDFGKASEDNSEHCKLHIDNRTSMETNQRASSFKQPIDECDDEASSSAWKAAFNVTSYMEDAGFLALPYVVRRGGIAAVLALLAIPLLFRHTATLLIDCLYDEEEDGTRTRTRTSYRDIGAHCWGPCGGTIISALLFYDWFSSASSYLVFAGSLLTDTLPDAVPLSKIHWIAVATLVVLPTVFLKTLSQIAWLSLIANIALLVSFVFAIVIEVNQANKWDMTSFLFWDTSGFFIAATIVAFSYGGHSIMIEIEGSMRDPSLSSLVWSLAYSFTPLVKLPFAVLGFLTFGSATDEVFVANLPPGVVRYMIVGSFLISILFAYAIPVLLLVESCEKTTTFESIQSRLPDIVCFIAVRLFVVLLTFLYSIAVPHFAFLLSLNGCIADYSLSIILPCAMHLSLKRNRLSLWQKALDCLFIIIGVIGSVGGFGFTLFELITKPQMK